jgi:hypothetical protein
MQYEGPLIFVEEGESRREEGGRRNCQSGHLGGVALWCRIRQVLCCTVWSGQWSASRTLTVEVGRSAGASRHVEFGVVLA